MSGCSTRDRMETRRERDEALRTSTSDWLSPQGILEMASAFQKSRVRLTAYELDLFTVPGEERRSSAAVAQALGTEERATDRLMQALP